MPSPVTPIIPTCFKGLPICDAWNDLKKAIQDNQVIIVTGETGSGKSTQLPKICLAAGRGRKRQIACTQPRRIAAVSVAARVASELGSWGKRHVGYKIRFSSSSGKNTRIKFITDGMLLAEMQKDRLLKSYDTIIVDEAHERSLNIDFILGALRRIITARPDLKVIITSATMDTEKFLDAFPGSKLFHIGGRGFPVDVIYDPPERDEKGREPCIVDSTVDAVRKIMKTDREGDILVFLPTENDILETVRILRSGTLHQDEQKASGNLEILPIYGRLSSGEQQRIFRNTGRRKVVVATNIAETSITVPGITWVVDSGLARISTYSISSRTRALPVLPISKASAEQRAGRAGRVKPGICVRLYSEEDFEKRREHTPPEILRSNLAEVILKLAAMNLGSAEEFPFIDAPSRQAIREGMTTLREIGAIDIRNRITKMGRIMARLPIDPRIARVILQSIEEKCLPAALVVAAALSIQDPRERPSEKSAEADAVHARFRDAESDFITLLNIWQAFYALEERGESRNSMRRFCRRHFLSWNRMREWGDIFNQFSNILFEARLITPEQKRLLSKRHLPFEHVSRELRTRLHRSIVAGFLSHIAMKTEGHEYMAARGREVHIFPGSVLFKQKPKCLVAIEFVRTSRLFARTAATVDPAWAEELGAQFCKVHTGEPYWSKRRGEVMATQRVTLWGLTLVDGRSISYRKVDFERAREIFISQGLAQGELRRKYGFIKHNQRLLDKFMEMESRTRQRGIMADHDVLIEFYTSALQKLEALTQKKICDETTLARSIRIAGSDRLLRLHEEFIRRHCREPEELSKYPGHIKVSGHTVALTYRFQPGDPMDGVTALIPQHTLEDLRPEEFHWLVPGLLDEKVEALLKGLPKKIRKNLVPVPTTAARLVPELKREEEPDLRHALSKALLALKGMKVDIASWPDELDLPTHLRMHFVITDQNGRKVGRGDDLLELRRQFCNGTGSVESLDMNTPEIVRVRRRFEKRGITADNFPSIPKVIKVQISQEKKGRRGKRGSRRKPGQASAEVSLFPAVSARDDGTTDLILVPSRQEASRLTHKGMRKLVMAALDERFKYIRKMCDTLAAHGKSPSNGRDTASLKRSARSFSDVGKPISTRRGIRDLSDNTWRLICRELAGNWSQVPDRKRLNEFIGKIAPSLVSRAQEIIALVETALSHADSAVAAIKELENGRFTGPVTLEVAGQLRKYLALLFPHDFPARFTPGELEGYPRYLKALGIMAQRTAAAPGKQGQKSAVLAQVYTILETIEALPRETVLSETHLGAELAELRTLCREYVLSVQAQEVGAVKGASIKRINSMWEKLAHELNIESA